MFDYEKFFNNDNQTIFPNPFESNLSPFEMNFTDNKDDCYYSPFEVQSYVKEEEFSEILKPMQIHEEDLEKNEVDEVISNKNEFRFDDIEMGEEYKGLEMALDEENNDGIEEDNEEIQKINVLEGIQSLETKEKIFGITKNQKRKGGVPKYPRIDDCKIFWRTKINKWYFEALNEEIKKSDLPKQLKKIIHSPSYKKFTQVVKCQTNYDDLQKTMATILCIGKETNKNQKQNYENIKAILTHYERNPSKSVEKIVTLLKMTYEKAIEKFYETDKFKELKSDEGAVFYDKEVVKQKKISIFQEKGLIKLFKIYFTKEGKEEKMIGKKRKN